MCIYNTLQKKIFEVYKHKYDATTINYYDNNA